ncbi:DUF2997 domain-containing protein [Actinomadura rugatobispora]|uniref:DUF2997 domain-containing protein n=1 Tax=Actinomadura rugatobispora TaxID=1994 RepID=A0ABW1AGV7_9ACTN|nr:hypothetical protein GCM10010200_085420 [Actinomadura rugatobispora]
MAEQNIEVTIAPDGTVGMHVDGIAGMGCLEETEDLVRMLGGDVETREMTAEAYVEDEAEAGQDRRDQVWG